MKSKITLPSVYKGLSQIIEGFKNTYAPEEALKNTIREVSIRRLSICDTCKSNSKHADPKSLRPDTFCTECGCNLEAKTKCLSCDCPLKKWLEFKT